MTSPNTVLIVDDEKAILTSLSRALADTDMDILLANSGQEALELVKKQNIWLF